MTGPAEIEVTLPRGIVVDGRVDRRAGLRAFTGRDEEFLLAEGRAMLPAERNTAMLARCVTSLGPQAKVSVDDVRDLCLGDRESLLLHLCAAAAGRRLHGVIECPDPDCKENLDVDLDISDLLGAPYDDVHESYEAALARDDGNFLIRFRLPTGLHQERAARLFLTDAAGPERYIADAVIEEISSEGTLVEGLPDDLLDEFADVVEALDPRAELRLRVACPQCETNFSVLFDPGEFLFREMAARHSGFYDEVHLLAFYYHWSEADILTLPVDKRRLYLGLIADELSEGAPV
jgi:hypothetical protein